MKSETIFGRLQEITVIVINVKPRVSVPSEASFPILLKHIDVVRRTKTTLDVLLESRIGDYWNVDGDRDASDLGISFTQFTTLNAKPPDTRGPESG